MNRDDITRMAREAGFVGFDGDNGSLRRFAALVAASERDEVGADLMCVYRRMIETGNTKGASIVEHCMSLLRLRAAS